MVDQNYKLWNLVVLFLEANTHWADEVNQYHNHLLEVLLKAYKIDLNTLNAIEEAELLNSLKSTYQNVRTPISNALDATLVLRKFPILEDIDRLCGKQKSLIKEVVVSIMKSKFPDTAKLEFSLTDLKQFGYDSTKEPDYDQLYEDY